MLVQYIAERINEDTKDQFNWIRDEKYDFLYSPQDRSAFERILEIDEELGRNSFDITEWEGYKLYHNNDTRIDDTFYVTCPSGKVFFFSMYYNRKNY